MATTKKRLPVRASATLQDTIREAGPVGAATEGLLWLGVAAAGLSLPAAARREIARLLNVELAPELLDALQYLYDQTLTGVAVGVAASGSIGDTRSDTTHGITSGVTVDHTRRPSSQSHQSVSRTPSITPSASPIAPTLPSPSIGDDWQEFDD